MQTEVHINLKKEIDDSYDIVIGTSLPRAARDILRSFPSDHYFLISDSNVKRAYGNIMLRSIKKNGVRCAIVAIPAGEQSKSRKVKDTLEDKLLLLGIDRNSVIIALGGGMVGDLAGFIASTLLRGISYIQIPTTLLAQVDSAVGGKVAINHPLGKNLFGAFHQPRRVYIDVGTLTTLPDLEFANGMAEVVKYGAILDAPFVSFLEDNTGCISGRNESVLAAIIKRCCELKAHVVGLDEKEFGYRRVLNFGHTIGHALESLSRYRLLHGQAVAVGMVAEARISASLGLLRTADVSRLERLLSGFHLPTRIPGSIDIGRLCRATLQDKKTKGGIVHYTLLSRLGKARVGVGVSHQQVQRILAR